MVMQIAIRLILTTQTCIECQNNGRETAHLMCILTIQEIICVVGFCVVYCTPVDMQCVTTEDELKKEKCQVI